MKRTRSTTSPTTTSKLQIPEFLKQRTSYYDDLESIENAFKKQKTDHKERKKVFDKASIKFLIDKHSLENNRDKYLAKIINDRHFDDWGLITSDQLPTLTNDQLTYLVHQRYHYGMGHGEPNFLYYPTHYEHNTNIKEDIDVNTDKMIKVVDMRGLPYWGSRGKTMWIRTPEQRRAIEIHWLTIHCCINCNNVTHRPHLCDVLCKMCGKSGHTMIKCDSKIKKILKKYPKLKQVIEDMLECDTNSEESDGWEEEEETEEEEIKEEKKDDSGTLTHFNWGVSNFGEEINDENVKIILQ